tara:strand:- start:1735 stop:1983 length:249 start_codon:yes stop_codon:yes gene_type:complete
MCLFYYRLSGDVKNENLFIDTFTLSTCLRSYKDFMHILWLIYKFNAATDNLEKEELKNTYLQVSKKLKYPFFSENYLQNYFG